MKIIGAKKTNLINSISQLQEANYSSNPELDAMYTRLLNGREQFEEALAKNFSGIDERYRSMGSKGVRTL